MGMDKELMIRTAAAIFAAKIQGLNAPAMALASGDLKRMAKDSCVSALALNNAADEVLKELAIGGKPDGL